MQAQAISDGEVDAELKARGATDVEMKKSNKESFHLARNQEGTPM